MLSLVSQMRSYHHRVHLTALSEGLKKLGVNVNITQSETTDTQFVACWGWRTGLRMRQKGHEVIVMERGYIGDRFKYTSIGWNGLNGHAEFPDYPESGDRFDALGIELKPWHSGEYALILGQVPGDASLQGKNLSAWYEETAEAVKAKYGIPVKFRPHPDVRKRGIYQPIGIEPMDGSLDDALSGAAFTVCYNSNGSVDSLLSGTPCVVADKGSMGYELCGKSIDEIITPDRETWANRLAYKQWTIEEIESGKALEPIAQKILGSS